jgi:hypothetical protein
MRSISFTLLLLCATVGLALAAVMRFSEGSLDRLFGARAAGPGDYLYRFEPERIHRILLSGNGVKATCVYEQGIWRVTEPWSDRMDPTAADGILNFTLGTRAVDIIPDSKLDTAKAGLRDGTIGVRIEDREGNSLATYLLGRRTEWIHRDPETKKEDPTVFLRPLEDRHRGYTYATTGDIHFLFRDGLRHLRDHHPFFFNPLALESVRIHKPDAELVLSRENSASPWRITKPLDNLRTDPDAVKKLLSDLYLLRALKVADRSEVSLPADDVNGRQRIALRHFGQKEEVVMEILPPATPEADTVFATVSDRPGTVFELRLKPLAAPAPAEGAPAPEPVADDTVPLAGLPDTVNELRNQMLTNIDVESLQGILISPATSEEILLAREKGKRWLVRRPDGRLAPLNELSLYRLLKAITGTKVAGFVSDAAVNLEPYGLDRPALKLSFVSFGSDRVDLLFGLSRDGVWHVMRAGVPTVMKLDDTFITEVATRSWQWRDPAVWSFSSIDLLNLERRMEGSPPLQLTYESIAETWVAVENGTDRSAELATERADRLLQALARLQCDTWLGPDDANASAALAAPVLRFEIGLVERDANAERKGVRRRELLLAPASDSPLNRVFYGRIDGEPQPFLMSADAVSRLTVDLFGDD